MNNPISKQLLNIEISISSLKKYFMQSVLNDFNEILKDDNNKMNEISQTTIDMLVNHLQLLQQICDEANVVDMLKIISNDLNSSEYKINVSCRINSYIKEICELNDVKIIGYLIEYHQAKNIISKINMHEFIKPIVCKYKEADKKNELAKINTTDKINISLLRKYFMQCVLDDFNEILKDDKNKMQTIVPTAIFMLSEHLKLLRQIQSGIFCDFFGIIINDLNSDDHEISIHHRINCYMQQVCSNIYDIYIICYLIEYHQARIIMNQQNVCEFIDKIENKMTEQTKTNDTYVLAKDISTVEGLTVTTIEGFLDENCSGSLYFMAGAIIIIPFIVLFGFVFYFSTRNL